MDLPNYHTLCQFFSLFFGTYLLLISLIINVKVNFVELSLPWCGLGEMLTTCGKWIQIETPASHSVTLLIMTFNSHHQGPQGVRGIV